MSQLSEIKEKIQNYKRLSVDEAKFLYENTPSKELAALAQTVKSRYHDPHSASYLIMAIINYTNVCVAKCDYCAFYRLPHQSGTYLLNFAQICERVDRLRAFGGTLVSFNGGFHPDLRIADYADLFHRLNSTYPELTFFEMTVAEFMFACKRSKLPYSEGAQLLKAAGTRWITGGGAEVLDDGFRRRHSPGKFTVADYYQAQRAVIEAGLATTATMVIGFDESLEERFSHLEGLRNFQDSVQGAVKSFLCWTYKPYNTSLGGAEISSEEYLRWLAVSRIFLDNFVHIRTSVLTQNEKALAGILFGADDFDLPTEDEVTQKAGAVISHQFAEILAAGRNLGLKLTHRAPWSHQSQDMRAVPPAETAGLTLQI